MKSGVFIFSCARFTVLGEERDLFYMIDRGPFLLLLNSLSGVHHHSAAFCFLDEFLRCATIPQGTGQPAALVSDFKDLAACFPCHRGNMLFFISLEFHYLYCAVSSKFTIYIFRMVNVY